MGKVRGQIAEHGEEYEGKNGGTVGKKDTCEISDYSNQHNLSLYSDEKSIDSKGKENSKDDVSDATKAGKEKSLASEWGQRKKKKKKRSKSRSKERKPLTDKDYENRKRKHTDDGEGGKDVTKSKKEKRRSTSRDHEE